MTAATRLAGILTATTLAVVAMAMPAAALEGTPDTYEGDGLWYFDWNGIQDFHDQGIDGTGITIAMIDSPVNLEVPTLKGADITPIAPMGCSGDTPPATSTDVDIAVHGTNVASFLVGTGAGYEGQTGVKGLAPGAKLLAYATYAFLGDTIADPCDGALQTEQVTAAINDAVARGADIISISLGTVASDELIDALANAAAHDVIVVAALENHDRNFTGMNLAPASLNTVLSVGAVRPDGRPLTDTFGQESTDIDTDVVAPGFDLLTQGFGDAGWTSQSLEGGTSFATPITAAEIALVMQMHPDATPNQVLNSLVFNTGTGGSHDVEFDTTGAYGYGIVATSFLAANPAEHEDVNPFLGTMSRYAAAHNDPSLDDGDWGPTQEQIDAHLTGTDPTASATPDPSATPTPNTPSETGSGTLTWILIGGAALVLIVITGIVIAIIATTRAKGSPSTPGPQ